MTDDSEGRPAAQDYRARLLAYAEDHLVWTRTRLRRDLSPSEELLVALLCLSHRSPCDLGHRGAFTGSSLASLKATPWGRFVTAARNKWPKEPDTVEFAKRVVEGFTAKDELITPRMIVERCGPIDAVKVLPVMLYLADLNLFDPVFAFVDAMGQLTELPPESTGSLLSGVAEPPTDPVSGAQIGDEDILLYFRGTPHLKVVTG